MSNQLLFAEIDRVTDEVCFLRDGMNLLNSLSSYRTFCAGNPELEQPKSPCNGDSGQLIHLLPLSSTSIDFILLQRRWLFHKQIKHL